MAESTVVRTKRDGLIVITAGALSYTVAYETGDFQYDVPAEGVELFLDRGAIGTVPSIRKGDDQPVTGSFSVYMRDPVSAAHSTMLDIGVLFSGGYVTTNMTSTIGTASDLKTFTIAYTQEGSDFGASDVTVTFPYCTIRCSVADGYPNVVNVTFTSHAVRPTFS